MKYITRLFKRVAKVELGILTMPDEYIKGYREGFVKGREAQRQADIEVAKRTLTFR